MNRAPTVLRLRVLSRGPCDGCHLADDCKAKQMACRVFMKFVDTGEIDDDIPRAPTRGRWKAMFGKPEV